MSAFDTQHVRAMVAMQEQLNAITEMTREARALEIRNERACKHLNDLMHIIEGDETIRTSDIAGWSEMCFLTGRETPQHPPAEEGKD